MKIKTAILLLTLCVPFAASAQDDCARNLARLSALYSVRSAMIEPVTSSYEVDRAVDRQISDLREPLPDGGYRWVMWVRPDGEGEVEKRDHSVVGSADSHDYDAFEASGDHLYGVRIVVPRKRSLLKPNNDVYVGHVTINYTVDGRTKTIEKDLNQWFKPDTSKTFDLGVIADNAQVSVESATGAANSKQAVVEVHFRKAVARDDPDNPNYDTIMLLNRLQHDPVSIDTEIARAEHAIFPDSQPVPVTTIITQLREAKRLMASSKTEEQEKGHKLLDEVMRTLPR